MMTGTPYKSTTPIAGNCVDFVVAQHVREDSYGEGL